MEGNWATRKPRIRKRLPVSQPGCDPPRAIDKVDSASLDTIYLLALWTRERPGQTNLSRKLSDDDLLMGKLKWLHLSSTFRVSWPTEPHCRRRSRIIRDFTKKGKQLDIPSTVLQIGRLLEEGVRERRARGGRGTLH